MLANRLKRQISKRTSRMSNEEHQRRVDQVLAFQTGPFKWLADLPCSLLFGRDLKVLATVYMSDKWNKHWYAQHYENTFRQLRRKKINVLEIGIGGYENPKRGGGSLRMWRTYFPKGRIYGVDIYDKSFHNQRRIKTFQGSQVDPVFLDSVVREIGKVDIIIDDGSHRNDHVLFTFQHLFPHLADEGFYVVEDTQTSYWEDYGGNAVDHNVPNTIMGYFKSLTDGVNWEEFPGAYNPTYFEMNIKFIAFYHNLIVIKKDSLREGPWPPRSGLNRPNETPSQTANAAAGA